MKNLTTKLLIIFSLMFFSAKAQDYNTRFQEAFKLSEQGKFDDALVKFQSLLKENPNHSGLHVQISWNYLLKNDFTQAAFYANNSYELIQTDMASNLVVAYALLGSNQKEQGMRYLNQALWLDPDGSNLANLQKDFADLIKFNVNPTAFRDASAYAATAHPARNKAFVAINSALREGDRLLGLKNFTAAKTSYDKALAGYALAPAEYKFLKVLSESWVAEGFLNYSNDYDFLYATMLLEDCKAYPGLVLPTARINAAYIVMETYTRKSDYDKALAIANTYKSELSKGLNYGNYKANFLFSYAKSIKGSQQEDANAWTKLIPVAQQLKLIRNTSLDAYYQAHADNFFGVAYSYSTLPVDRKKSASYFQSALAICKTFNLKDLEDEISPNLAIVYWQQGDKEKAKQIFVEAGNKFKAAGKLGDAEINFNNAGAMYYSDKNFIEAAPLFQQAVNITEEIRKTLKGRDKILYFQKNVSAYQFLVASYARSGNGREVFNVQNKDRARLLSETIEKKGTTQNTSLESFQALLKPDEAALFYSQMEAGAFIINVVTKEGVSPVYLEDFQRWVDIKRKYLDRIHAADARAKGYKPALEVFTEGGITYKVNNIANLISHNDMDEIMELTRDCLQDYKGEIPADVTQTLLRAYYQSLIAPVFSKIAAKKKLIIFSDAILNFLPFESLIGNDNKYLIENFDVKYCQSADVYSTILKRNYTLPRKDFLGMGGAIYEDMSEKAEALRSPDQLVNLQAIAEENILSNKPQREIYAAIFGSKKMNYLGGTLQEIKNLSTIFTDRDVFYGADMTENRIKQMSVSGQLKKYKVLHLATHGFAVPQIPELSGVAMCIFNKMQGTEDGYLTAPEIAKLQLNCDLAVLSACETGLGKIYGGEGVSGLTASLLEAGANQALVTLWSVSDQGTMYYMTGLYNLVTKEGKNYAEAASIMKRKFIAGEFGAEYKKFNYWAPYVSYGK